MNSSMSFKYCALSLAIAAATQSTILHAEQEDSNTLTIYGDTYRNTASKSSLEAEETPQGITIVSKEELDKRSVESLSEAVRYTSGVTTDVRGSVTRLDLLHIRGFENKQHLYDGLPLLYNNGWLQPQVDAAAVEQVEVFKGPTSVLYGSMAPGGMVNVISKQPSAEEKNSVSLHLGSNNFAGVGFNSQGNIADNENFTYTLTGIANRSDSQTDVVDDSRIMLSGSVDWQVSEDTLINFNFYRQRDPDQGEVSGLPIEGFNGVNPSYSSGLTTSDINLTESETDTTMVGYKINHNINDDWTFLHNTRFTSASTYQADAYNTGFVNSNASAGIINRSAYYLDESIRGFSMDNQLAGKFKTGDIEHNVLFGLDVTKFNNTYTQGGTDTVPTLDLYNPDYDQINIDTLWSNIDTYFYAEENEIEKAGVYLQDQIRLDNWIFIAGARYDYYTQESKKTYNIEGYDYYSDWEEEDTEKEVTTRFGLMYNFDNGISPFISYAESFEPEGGSDFYGNSFDATRGTQVELGFKYSPLESDTAATLSLFKIVKDNSLTADPNNQNNLIQIGEVESKGIEFDISHAFTDALSVSFNATVMDVETLDATTVNGVSYEAGTTPIWTAEKTASLWINYELPESTLKNSSISAGLRYIGETQIDADNSTGTAPDYTVMDLAFNMDLSNVSPKLAGGSLALSVNNVFDKEAYICYDSKTCWSTQDRNIKASINYKF